eukprot:gnl/TRDRNA2_/TRDRNA2_76914_c0_seq1.p2 gnl/TRDRNA2_/TRDRNA2_76914_c0~~gnl/TRDRNA2_/TRDRNA2_76914_c0_seq1.p2  ORF type:complete len:113 (+),score=6.50 gnl/TRDRNA2_/TRDRNA2_76914_c0_seq1:232-570(+)
MVSTHVLAPTFDIWTFDTPPSRLDIWTGHLSDQLSSWVSKKNGQMWATRTDTHFDDWLALGTQRSCCVDSRLAEWKLQVLEPFLQVSRVRNHIGLACCHCRLLMTATHRVSV